MAEEGSRLAGAVLQKIKEKREPADFLAKHKRAVVGLGSLLKQPTLRTEKDIGSENPETTAVSGFCYAIFSSETQ